MTLVDFIVEKLECLNKERRENLIDAETYFWNKQALIKQAKLREKKQQGYTKSDVETILHIHSNILEKEGFFNEDLIINKVFQNYKSNKQKKQ